MDFDTQDGTQSVDLFKIQLERTLEAIRHYYNIPIDGLKDRTFSYKGRNFDTDSEIEGMIKFLDKYYIENPCKLNEFFDFDEPQINKYDDFHGHTNKRYTFKSKLTNLYDVFMNLIVPSLTSDNVKVIETPIVQSIDANTFWTAEGAKATKRGVWVAAISLVVTALITVVGIVVTHHDAVLDRQSQAIEQTVPQNQSESTVPGNANMVVVTESL